MKTIPESEHVFTMRGVAESIGISEPTLRRWLKKQGMNLPRWGKSERSVVFCPRTLLGALEARHLRSKGK